MSRGGIGHGASLVECVGWPIFFKSVYMYSHQKRKLFAFLATVVAYTGAARAQTRLSGAVVDSVSHQNMEGASIRLVTIHGKDTTAVAGAIAKYGGRFTFSHIDPGAYHLSISFQGYAPFWRAVTVGDEPEHLTLFMYPAAYELQGLVITDTRPVRMHGDTTAYNADKFHTAPNASIGDLLRKMPGVDMIGGTAIAQGDTVKRILINGKRFFSNDLDVALKYLPRDIVSNIEIFDDKSDQAKFTGVDDGVRIRTINIVLKKNIKADIFGRASIEAGTATGSSSTTGALYKGDVSLNHFRGDKMISFIGNIDNTSPTLGGVGTNGSVGLSYTDLWGKHTQVSGSYRTTGFSQDISNTTYTQNLLPGDSTINATAITKTNSRIFQHLVDVNVEADPSKSDHLTVHGSIAIDDQRNTTGSQTATTQGTTVPLNNSIAEAVTRGNDVRSDMDVVWGHRFAKAGRSASVEAVLKTTSGAHNGINQYDNTYFKAGASDSVSRVYQSYSSPNDHLATSVHATYEEPVFKNSSVQLEYILSTDQSTTGRSTYDLDSLSGLIDHVDSALTNRFKNIYRYQQGGAKFHFGNNRIQITTGIGLQDGICRSADLTTDTTLQYGYILFHPMTTVSLTPKKGMHIDFNYEGQGQVPPINDLQPVINNTNPLNIVVGNPNLRQSFTHTATLRLNSFDAVTSRHFGVDASALLTENSIVSVTHLNTSTGIDTSTFANLNGNYGWRVSLDYGLRLKRPASNLSLGAQFINNHNVGYINEVLNKTNNYNIGGMLRWTTNLPDHIDVNFTYFMEYIIGTFSAEPSQNTNYFMHNASVDGQYYTNTGWKFGTNLSYHSSSGRPVGFNPTSTQWNMFVSKLMFKNKTGEIKISANNILDQVNEVNAYFSASRIQNTTGYMLGRYVLLGFIYHIPSKKQGQ